VGTEETEGEERGKERDGREQPLALLGNGKSGVGRPGGIRGRGGQFWSDKFPTPV